MDLFKPSFLPSYSPYAFVRIRVRNYFYPWLWKLIRKVSKPCIYK